MKTTYTAKTTIHALISKILGNAITQPSFVKEFLPEIKKNMNEVSTYILNRHPNAERVQPMLCNIWSGNRLE